MTSKTVHRPSETIRIAKPFHNEEIEKNVISVLRSGKLVQGQYVKRFEEDIARWIGCKHVVAVSSGTAALHSAISALKVSKRTRKTVITTPLSFAATANAIIFSGCKPIFVDVDEETFNIDPTRVEDKMSNETLAIEPVDTYGLPADLESLRDIGSSKGATVVEDAAEAIGARFKGKKIGSFSSVTCFSTYATKNLHTGEGGFVTTDNDQLAQNLRTIRNQGQASRYNQVLMGYNYRMMEISAAIGLGQIPLLEGFIEKRRANALYLIEHLKNLPGISFQHVDDPGSHAWYMLAVRLDAKKAGIGRDVLVSKLKEAEVEADIAWPTPIHLQPYYRETFGYKKGDFPSAEKICSQVFQLPIQPFLTRNELERIVSVSRNILGN